MNPETKYNIKAFAWDQLIRPITNSEFLRLVFLIMIFVSIIIFKSTSLFFIFIILTLIVSIYDLIKYYQSGEYKDNYRKYKYPDYRKAMKELKQARKNSPINNIGGGDKQNHLGPPFKVLDISAIPKPNKDETTNSNSE